MWDAGDSYGALFRKVVTIGDVSHLTESRVTTYADDDIAVWVNGVQVFQEADFGVYDGNTIALNVVDLASALVTGDNVIALYAQDTVGGCRSAWISGTISTE